MIIVRQVYKIVANVIPFGHINKLNNMNTTKTASEPCQKLSCWFWSASLKKNMCNITYVLICLCVCVCVCVYTRWGQETTITGFLSLTNGKKYCCGSFTIYATSFFRGHNAKSVKFNLRSKHKTQIKIRTVLYRQDIICEYINRRVYYIILYISL